ncbi:MAG: superoxide dismutase [Pseudomonadales bacterium]
MSISLPTLPFPQNALAPVISERTMEFHYGKHHLGYVDKLNVQLHGTGLEQSTLPEIIRSAWRSGNQAVFNNAAQAWNHDFYWYSLRPQPAAPDTELQALIDRDFGSTAKLLESLVDAALKQFGSGWAWLVWDADRLKVVTTSNADCPLVHDGQTALLTIDVWEHAYYLDYQNDRKRYVEAVANKLLDWEAAASRLRLSNIHGSDSQATAVGAASA